MAYFLNVDRFGNEVEGAKPLDVNLTAISYVPSATGNTQNLNSLVVDPNGNIWIIDFQGDAKKLNITPQLDVLLTVQPAPNPTGNTTNLNSVFKDAAGDTWIVDFNGDAIKVAIAPVPETITNITNTVSGHKIGTYTNESGVAVDINETVTSVATFSITGNTITLGYVDEAGTTNTKTLVVPADVVTTLTNALTAGNKIGTYTNESGAAVDLYETITSVNDFSIAGSVITLKYIDEAGVTNTKTLTLPAETAETVTTLTNALLTGNKIGTYTNESGTAVDINETITSVSELSILGNVITLKYIDEAGVTNTKTVTIPSDVVTTIASTITGHKIGTYTNESGTAVDINETVTSVSELSILGSVITLKYVDEAGVENTKTVTLPSAASETITTLTDAITGHKIGTYTNESGTAVDINETITSIGTITYNSATGVLTIPYTDEAGVVNNKTVTLPTPLNVLTTVQPTPTATGNTTNLNSSFKDAAGNTWIVDSNGDAIQAGSVAFKNLNEFHVDPNGSDVTGDGSQEKPFQTIGKAVSVAVGGDQVIVHAGVYNENLTLSNPNIALVGAQSEYGSLTQINGSVTVTASGTSVKIADIGINSVVHSGSAPLYLENVTVYTTFNSSSAGYVEISNSSIQDGAITKSAGIILIEESKIDNVNIIGTNTVGSVRNSYQDLNSTITYGAGTVYNIQNVQGGEVVVNAAAIALETAALVQGLSAEMAKEAESADFMKLGMLRPDLEASPTKIVTWDEATGRLEVSELSAVGDNYKTVSSTCQDIVSTGNITVTVEKGLAYTPLQDIILYHDANNHMHGEVVSYDAATGVLVMNVHQKTGSGNYCSWVANLDGIKVSEVSVSFGTSAPTSAGVEGDEYFITSNGTSTGTITAQYIYDATSSTWRQVTQVLCQDL